ncbi:MAG: anthranilate synthase component I family protein [Candidatus Peregrinibacteria bacterium]|nr:anthranilate synthase component I family protein [Candidatus Peregrinibacteria bacterium]
MFFKKFYKEIKCEDASKVFSKICNFSEKSFLLESKDISHIYGRLSLLGVDPAVEIRGKNDEFEIVALNERGEKYLAEFTVSDFGFCDECEISREKISGKVLKMANKSEETNRTKKKNIAQVIRMVIEKFKQNQKELIGLYGALSYDFIRLFEDIPENLPDIPVDDFRLCLYDTFIFFDHLKEKAEITVYRETEEEAHDVAEKIFEMIQKSEPSFNFKIENAKFEYDENDYKGLVANAKDLAKRGELFEVVYSNTLKADFSGDAFALYKKYREVNPSPYLFYFNFGDEQLVGASPEMMVRVENGLVHLRPISGTAKRGSDPIEDHENMLALLSSEKERAELDMLIDLGRNDLAVICEPGIEISDYRFVEKYSKVMHTVAHLSGKLRAEFTALDALIACLNAGTLTGAPKVAAMIEIEKNETSRRGYYGGTIGYFTFSGEMDTGIIIRTAHIRGAELSFRSGATLLYDSQPEAEYQETMNKARAFLMTFQNE